MLLRHTRQICMKAKRRWNIDGYSTKQTSTPPVRNFGTFDNSGKSDGRTSGKRDDKEDLVSGKPTYVHPLSQIVLEHLQSTRSLFLTKTGLDRGLKLNEDGTFVLFFPDAVNEKDSKIWTSYDKDEKKHWLAVKKGKLVGRYLLQDNLKPAWHSSKLSTPEKVQDAVDQMIFKIEKK